MSRDDEVGSGESEELRRVLRRWKAPGAPPEIEEQLRQTFRQRRSRRDRTAWLALAASVVALAGIYGLSLLRPGVPSSIGRSAARPSSAPLPTVTGIEPTRSESPSQPAAVGPQEVPHLTTPRRRAEPEIIVEPGQGELLRQLAREWRGARQIPPGVSVPRLEEIGPEDAPPTRFPEAGGADMPPHRTVWEPVAGEWLLHRAS
jgi:hypothetical protein